MNIAIIMGSTRPNRNGEAVAKWIYQMASKRSSETFELVDLKDYELPLLDEPIPASQGKYSKAHTQKWAAKIDSFDAFVFVTPEYNHSMPGALKNALDFLYKEWNNKAAGFVSYGSAGGSRAVEHLRLVMAELMIADVHAQVMFSLETDFVDYTEFKPDPKHEQKTNTMLDEVVDWGNALKGLRTQQTHGSITRGVLNEYSDVKKMFYKSD